MAEVTIKKGLRNPLDEAQVRRAVLALQTFVAKKSEERAKAPLVEDAEFVSCILTRKLVPGKTSLKPIPINLPHPLHDEGAEICLFVKDEDKKRIKEALALRVPQADTVYGMFLMAAAMASAVSAGAGKLCDMDPAPAVTPAPLPATEAPASPATEAPASPATEAPATEAPVAQTTEAPSTETEAPVTQDDTTQQQQQQSSTSAAGSDATQQSTTQQSTIAGGEQTTAGTVSSAYSYTGANCGGPGSYDQVTNIASCSKSTVTTSSPVSPFDTGVTVAFRGPMTIHNIAVFDGTNGTWCKVSDYENGGAATNMVFLNNENVDYTGAGSPEGFCKADGTGVAKQSTPFGGTLASASNPGKSILASENTGAEVHIMTDKQCGVDAQCEGAYDTDGTAFQGWTGGKKIFLTKVTMAEGGTPNVPAVWMLPDQVTHSGQYGCNCRGTGPAGGCGELDIAEVLEKDTSYVATHYYFYDGKYNPGNDQFAKRPTDGPATYVTIIDQDYGVKVLALGADDFDFSCGTISSDVVSQWEAAE